MKTVSPNIRIQLIEGVLDENIVSESLSDNCAGAGAQAVFSGIVRPDVIDGKTVTAIEFSSYASMAESLLCQIAQQTTDLYGLSRLVIYHSLGVVLVNGRCLWVLAEAPHRRQAIQACSHTVERLKQEVPIWGKEIFADSSSQWKENQ